MGGMFGMSPWTEAALPGHRVTTLDPGLAGTVSMPCTGDETAVIHYLSQWAMTADEDRFWDLEVVFLQFVYNPGNEHFTPGQIHSLRTFVAEQQGTGRWNDAMASL